jgi:DNA-binding response OmpR family regulator
LPNSGACGYTPRQFITPQPFFQEVWTSPPDLIVLDLALRQSDAVEVIRHLHAYKYKGDILLMSGRDEATLVEMVEIGERHGLSMLAPLTKPFFGRRNHPRGRRQYRRARHGGSAIAQTRLPGARG